MSDYLTIHSEWVSIDFRYADMGWVTRDLAILQWQQVRKQHLPVRAAHYTDLWAGDCTVCPGCRYLHEKFGITDIRKSFYSRPKPSQGLIEPFFLSSFDALIYLTDLPFFQDCRKIKYLSQWAEGRYFYQQYLNGQPTEGTRHYHAQLLSALDNEPRELLPDPAFFRKPIKDILERFAPSHREV
jgi:hypothetical protein